MAALEERRLQRAAERKIGGVCGGLAEFLGRKPRSVRIGFAALTVVSAIVPGVVVYLILWACLPSASTAPQR